jgi:hypothetical protein
MSSALNVKSALSAKCSVSEPASIRAGWVRVIDLAALGLINSAWRNTRVEDWNAEARMAAAVLQ